MSQIALVTGGNRGLGLGTVKALLRKGDTVILSSRSEEKGRKASDTLKQEFKNIHFHQLDVQSVESIVKCSKWIETTFGKLDILINNAGINYDTWHNALNADIQECVHTMNVNFFGPWRVTNQLLPLLRQSIAGRIVNVSSGSGSITLEESGTPGYSASKAALNILTIKQAHAMKGTNLKVNSVCPGWVRTDMGGSDATRSIDEGVKSIIWAAKIPKDGPSGGFFRDGLPIAW